MSLLPLPECNKGDPSGNLNISPYPTPPFLVP